MRSRTRVEAVALVERFEVLSRAGIGVWEACQRLAFEFTGWEPEDVFHLLRRERVIR